MPNISDTILYPKRIVIAITGATGVIYAKRLLETFYHLEDIESHLIVSDAGFITLQQELQLSKPAIYALADATYHINDITAALASGSFQTIGMIVAPCSMKTLASIAIGLSDNLISRAADVTLKERRRLLLMVRETPFNLAHLRNMTAVTEMGGIIFPPLPAFYQHPTNIDAMVNHTVGRVLDLFDIPHTFTPEWQGITAASLTKKRSSQLR